MTHLHQSYYIYYSPTTKMIDYHRLCADPVVVVVVGQEDSLSDEPPTIWNSPVLDDYFQLVSTRYKLEKQKSALAIRDRASKIVRRAMKQSRQRS